MSTATPTDEQVKSYIDSVPGLRQEWGIPQAKRLAMAAFVIMNICLLALIIGAFAYFLLANSSTAFNGVSGLIIVIVLVYIVSGIRFFQLKAERAELPKYRTALMQKLTGNPATDGEAQNEVDANFKWESLKYRLITRMIGLAGIIIIAINTYQIGVLDYARTLLFDAAILAFFAGAFWNNYAFKADILEVQLEERSRSTIKWQTEHPGEAEED